MKRLFLVSMFLIASVVVVGALFLSVGNASTNILSDVTKHWAWNDAIGWINFYSNNNVTVSSAQLTGYASSSVGDISLDCATTRSGNICSPTNGNYKVSNNGAGGLSGWGWNDTYGWISFDCNDIGSCSPAYRVLIDSSGDFQGFAWNDVIGWISFNCNDLDFLDAGSDFCGNRSNYRVSTTWQSTSTSGYLDSVTYDTQSVNGAALNSVLWHGSQPLGTSVKFQFAVSNSSSGPWNYQGPDGTSAGFYTVGPDSSMPLNFVVHNNRRFFRYRVTLVSNQSQTATPRVDAIIVNWSP